MKTGKKAIPYLISLIISCVPMGQISVCRATEAVDHGIFAELLLEYVKDGVVDYRGFKNCEPRLDSYLFVLEKTDTKALSRNERFAFYINAYNAWTIKLVLEKYPGIKTFKDKVSLWIKVIQMQAQWNCFENITKLFFRPNQCFFCLFVFIYIFCY